MVRMMSAGKIPVKQSKCIDGCAPRKSRFAMELSDLRLFVTATRHRTLLEAAGELHLTASAVSRAIRRLEDDLHSPLFDRAGKSLRLNAAGQRLRERALALLALADQTRAEFEGADFGVRCRIAAPPLLQWRFGAAIAATLSERFQEASLALRPAWEDDALAALARGEVDFAIVTDEPLRDARSTSGFEAIALGTLTMQVAAGTTHPLASKVRGGAVRAPSARVLAHDFACPSRSMLGGQPRGTRADGWRDDELPRRIRYWVDDLQVLLSLVRQGHALAYLPAFALRECGLVQVRVSDCPFECVEQAHLVWRPVVAAGWQGRLVDALRLPDTA
jgi:DNA-binding transcriptional LysR family regulator